MTLDYYYIISKPEQRTIEKYTELAGLIKRDRENCDICSISKSLIKKNELEIGDLVLFVRDKDWYMQNPVYNEDQSIIAYPFCPDYEEDFDDCFENCVSFGIIDDIEFLKEKEYGIIHESNHPYSRLDDETVIIPLLSEDLPDNYWFKDIDKKKYEPYILLLHEDPYEYNVCLGCGNIISDVKITIGICDASAGGIENISNESLVKIAVYYSLYYMNFNMIASFRFLHGELNNEKIATNDLVERKKEAFSPIKYGYVQMPYIDEEPYILKMDKIEEN